MKLGMAFGFLAWAGLQPWLMAGPLRVALLGFQPETADLALAELSNAREFQLIERVELERILNELALSSSQNLKPADTLRVGKLLSADWLLFGQKLSLQGTNRLLVRIVDAHTGIIQDITVLATAPTNYLESARSVAAFLRSSQQNIRDLSQRQFVAVGAFTDLGVSKRFRDFEVQFRSWLTERFKTTAVAVVERSATEILANELRLSQAGLAEPRTNYTQAAPAFLIVDGIYQSFQDTNSKLNLVLRLQRVGEPSRTFTYNEPPGAALNEKLAQTIEKALTERRSSVSTISRQAEVTEQIRRGRELARIVNPEKPALNLSISPQRRRKDVSDGIDALRAALFLDPDNADVKYLLALCLIDPIIDRKEEARGLFAEVIAASTNAAFVTAAHECIASSYEGEDNQHAYELYAELHERTRNPGYSQRMAMLRRTFRLTGKVPFDKELRALTESWWANCRAEETNAAAGRTINYDVFISPFHQCSLIFSTLPNAERYRRIEEHMADVLPRLRAEFPRFTHYFTLACSDYFFGANKSKKPPRSLPREFDEMLSWCEEHGNEILSPGSFYPPLARKMVVFLRRKELDRARRIALIINKYARSYMPTQELIQFDAIEGFVQRESSNWAEAASAFQRLGDREIRMSGEGPWGANPVVNAAVYAKECQRRLTGEKAPEVPLFQLGPPLFTLREPRGPREIEGNRLNSTNFYTHSTISAPFVYVCDGPDIWAAFGRTLYRYNFSSGTLKPVRLGMTNASIIKAVAVHNGKIWIGTRTNGLIIADPVNGDTRNFTEADGLVSTYVSAIFPTHGRVWLGFSSPQSGGGLGYFDESTQRFIGFASELKPERWTETNAAFSYRVTGNQSVYRTPVLKIQDGGSNTLLLQMGSSVWHFSPEDRKWKQLYYESSFAAMDSNDEYVVAGSYEPHSWTGDKPRFGGVAICRRAREQWSDFSGKDSLPNGDVRSVALDGNKLWVGGRNFIAQIDLPTSRILRMTTNLPGNQLADSLRVRNGNVFVNVGSSLYQLAANF